MSEAIGEMEWMETVHRYRCGRYDVAATEWETLDGEPAVGVTVWEDGREAYHSGRSGLESFEAEAVGEYLRTVLGLLGALRERGKEERDG